MNKALKSALIELKSEGVTLDPIADLDHILVLDRLARQMMAPPSAGEAALFSPAITVGNVTLRRLSLGARVWLAEVVAEWYANEPRQSDLAHLYAMAHSDRPETLWAVQHDRAAMDRAIAAWSRTVTASMNAMIDAAARLHATRGEPDASTRGPGDYRAALGILHRWRPLPEVYRLEAEAALTALALDKDETDIGWGRIIEGLVDEYGGTAEDWAWRRPEDELVLLLANRRERMDEAASAEQQTRDGRFIRAHREFCMYKDNLARIKKGVK
jgi:hypothetical protein